MTSFAGGKAFLQCHSTFHRRVRLQLDLKPGLAEEGPVFIHQARRRELAVFRIEFHADAVSSVLERGHHRRGGAAEGIEHSVAGEREHLDEARSEFERIGRGMFLGRGAGNGPELLEPFIELVLG